MIQSSHRALLRRYLGPQRSGVVGLALLVLVSIALQLVGPRLLGDFIDAARTGAPVSNLSRIGLLFIGITLLLQAVTLAATYLGGYVGWTATNRLREDLTAHCLNLDLSFHKDHTAGELIERVDGDVTVLTNFFSRFTIELLGNVLLLVGILVILILIDWRMGLAVAVFAATALTVLYRIRSVARPFWAALRGANARFYGFISEALGAVEDVRANGAVPYVTRRFTERLREVWQPQRNAQLAFAVTWAAPILVFGLGDAVAFVLIARLYNSGQVSLGTGYTIFFYIALLARPVEQIRWQLQSLQQADASIDRVQELFSFTPSVSQDGSRKLPGGPAEVEFEGVNFGYDLSSPVLKNLSFRLEPGNVLGLLGRTGSGKTTLARLLFRFHDPQSGDIRLSGVSLKAVERGALNEQVGLVTQEVQLFHASLRDNLTFFNPNVKDKRLMEALVELELADWCDALPQGLATALDPNALSAGEAQLLAFTRLLLKDPGLIILDEASSRLDRATEARLERALDKLLRGRTAVVIAHRLATVRRADDILILEEGERVEYGPRQKLAEDDSSRFAQLLKTGLEEVLR